MTIPTDPKDGAIYHTILSDMHRMRAVILNRQTLDNPDTEGGLQEHFGREQNVLLGRLSEWRQRRPEIYRQASSDFEAQAKVDA